MSFFVYFAVLLVAAASALFGLDLLTSPLPPEKPKAQVAARTPPPNKLARREAEKQAADKQANAALTPVYPRPADENKDVRMVYPPTTDMLASVKGETTGSGKAEADTAQQPVAQQPVQQQAEAPPAQPAQPQQTLLTQQAPQQPFTPAQPTPAATPVTQPSGPQCDVSACAAAYRSFNAADCTYQPFEGARRLCEKPPAGEQARTAEAARPKAPEIKPQRVARQPNDEARMRDAVRRVKELTARNVVDDDFDDMPLRGRRVIVIERGREDFWR
jgi:hypothetical protein